MQQLIHCCSNFNYSWLINEYRQFSTLSICKECISCFHGNPQMEWSVGKDEWKGEVMHGENIEQEKIQC